MDAFELIVREIVCMRSKLREHDSRDVCRSIDRFDVLPKSVVPESVPDDVRVEDESASHSGKP